jgi:hypothetical protein
VKYFEICAGHEIDWAKNVAELVNLTVPPLEIISQVLGVFKLYSLIFF